jgi:hypothetical protein
VQTFSLLRTLLQIKEGPVSLKALKRGHLLPRQPSLATGITLPEACLGKEGILPVLLSTSLA